MVFLTGAEFGLLYAQIPVFWRPMVRFLVSSGTRFSEATALTPADIDMDKGTVRIVKAWKRGATENARMGVPKTAKSVRTINAPADALADLDLSDEYVFRNRQGNAVRANTFRNGVWNPAIERATGRSVRAGGEVPAKLLVKEPRIHDLRHTCASWMIAKGVPLPVIQDHFGHESITTTVDLYGHLDRSSMQAAAVAIGDVWDEIAVA
ncbi:site-specific integrase [Mycobacteroides abscessus]|uniref:site-specific integrase n=1 Tax=Mycobacteroides abscessus TaxID=36809 RepID=UPI001F35E80A|nr:site-specific integrase [Mycobacteroides abscessus]